MKKIYHKFTELISKAIEYLEGVALILVVAIAVLGIIVGFKYYRHTQENPQFCMSCHVMKEAFTEWYNGKHRDIICQKCHQLSIFEQNQLLVAYVMQGNKTKFSQTHGREKPWAACRECHVNETTQGSITMKKAYGHARHVFIQKIDCKTCHKGELHKFEPNEKACQQCHRDNGVHGLGMEAFSCLKCHSYSEKNPSMVPKDRCIKCHPKIPTASPMGGLLCHQCHRPHGEIIPKPSACVSECHLNETAVGQHALHLKKGLNCLDCHKAHTWVVGPVNAKTLCSRCHPYKDPRRFIY